jgi:hypothetical protein
MTPIRREALDLHWMPWAQENDCEEVREATRLLYACLDDPTLRQAARAAAWDAAWAAARCRSDCGGVGGEVRGGGCGEGFGEVRGVGRGVGAARYAAGRRRGTRRGTAAWAKINHRVGAAIIKEVLS